MVEVVAERRRPTLGERVGLGLFCAGGDGRGWVGRFFWGGGWDKNGYNGAGLSIPEETGAIDISSENLECYFDFQRAQKDDGNTH